MESPPVNYDISVEYQNKKILLLITQAPFSSQEPYKAYKYAKFLIKEGIKPILFHFMDGIYNLSNLPIHTLNFDNVRDDINILTNKGVRVIACSRCLLARGFWDKNKSNIDEKSIFPMNIVESVEVFGIQKLLDFIIKGFKVIKF